MFYSSPGSRWLTVHDLQHWMINGKKAHFIHRPAYLSAAHWYSCWKCGEKHSWMYRCGLLWKGFDIELSCSTAILLRSYLCVSQVEAQVSEPASWSDKMLSAKIRGFCNILIVSWWEASVAFLSFWCESKNAQLSNIRASILVLSHKGLREEQVCFPNTSVPLSIV